MNSRRVLVTGGAGFVGSHLVDELLAAGHEVRVLDNLTAQVHGPDQRIPDYLNPDAEFVLGDIRDPATIAHAIRDIDIVYHLAAAVGVAQSMYRIAEYTEVNTLGTANLLQAVVDSGRSFERLVVASSMSIYGEGRYVTADGLPSDARPRPLSQLRSRRWEPTGADGEMLVARPTDEAKQLEPTSIYAQNKLDQERMVLLTGSAYDIPSVALRLFNVYGPRQALANPYTGVAAIFANRLLRDESPIVFEDGEQSRDFVSVHDVVQGFMLAMERDEAVGQALNIGSERRTTVNQVADTLALAIGSERVAQRTGQYRKGDIRHCFGDTGLARALLGYAPRVTFEAGMTELAGWLREQEAPDTDGVGAHVADLAARGLTV